MYKSLTRLTRLTVKPFWLKGGLVEKDEVETCFREGGSSKVRLGLQ